MPVKAIVQPPCRTFFGDTPIEEFDGVFIRRNPAFVMARFLAGMGFPIDVQEVRKLARHCAEPVPINPCELAATSFTGHSAGVA